MLYASLWSVVLWWKWFCDTTSKVRTYNPFRNACLPSIFGQRDNRCKASTLNFRPISDPIVTISVHRHNFRPITDPTVAISDKCSTASINKNPGRCTPEFQFTSFKYLTVSTSKYTKGLL